MNKEKFIKELTKKLDILSEEEKNDIILEYEDIIEEKIKHGKTEEEAVKEFGDIDKLTKEILEAYKINPNYKNSDKSFFNNVEESIKKGAKKLSDTTEEVIDNINSESKNITTSNVVEFIIKLILILLFLAILKIPFYIVEEFGKSIFESSNIYLGGAVKVIWVMLVEIIYILGAIYILVLAFTKFKNSLTNNKKKQIEEKNDLNNNLSEKLNNKDDIKKQDNALSDIIVILLKIFIFVSFLIPLLFINISFIIALIFIIYLAFKNFFLIEFLVLIVGILIIGIYLFIICSKGLFGKFKVSIIPFIIGIVLTALGTFMSIDYMLSFTYYSYLPKNDFSKKTYTEVKKISKKTDISDDYEIIIDNKLEDNQVKFVITYYDQYINIDGIEEVNLDDYNIINISYSDSVKKEFSFKNELSDLVIKNLKKKKIYNYGELYDLSIKIYVNEKTKSLLE